MTIAKPTDEELRELFFLFDSSNEKAAASRMPSIEPIRLTDGQLDDCLLKLGNIQEPRHRERIRKKLVEAAEDFCNSYYYQEFPKPSQTERKFGSIQVAARKLLEVLELPDDSPDSKHFDIRSYLQIAAIEYGHRVGRPENLAPHEIHWSFWSTYKLPSVVTGVRLIEHWAGIARENLRRSIAQNKSAKHIGNRGRPAIRVLILRLALAWLDAHGQRPGDGVDGPFVRFAGTFIRAMKTCVTNAQRDHFSHIENTLSVSPQAIRNHARPYIAQLAASEGKAPGKRKKKG